MHGLIGQRLLNRFLGGIRHPAETDPMDETESPENDGKTTDRPDGPKPEKAQGKQEVEPYEENGILVDGKADGARPQH
jgi:hypothetical protein